MIKLENKIQTIDKITILKIKKLQFENEIGANENIEILPKEKKTIKNQLTD